MSLFDVIGDGDVAKLAAAPAPAVSPETTPEASAEGPAPTAQDAPASTPVASEAEAPPAPAQPKRLPSGVLDPPKPSQGDSAKGKPKGKGKQGAVSHEARERFAETFGPLLDNGFNMVAASVGSPIRADNMNESDPHNGLVLTVKFGAKSIAVDSRSPAAKAEAAKARETLGALFVTETPGRAVAYHAAAIAPALANLETFLQDHPFVTFIGVSLLTTAQFAFRVAKSAAPPPPIVAENKADGGT